MKTLLSEPRIKQGVLCLLLPLFAFNGGPVQANPQGGVVVHGQATISAINANQLRVHQKTPMTVINWDNFSIGAGELTRFVQPTNGTALNRVTSGAVSQIHGQLRGNANVYVVNPNGIVVGASGVIDVGGRAVLSTLDVDDDDFMNGGDTRFYGASNTGVRNFGTISSSGGDVVLMGGFVDNQGQIGALNGTVAIGSGGEILLQEGAGSTISVRGDSQYTGTGINNTGTIRGAAAELKAHGNVYALAINNGGAIRATGADRSSGRVLLRASGGSSNINLGNRSNIVATAGADGGSVAIESAGGQATLDGKIEAVGNNRGGNVAVKAVQIDQTASSVIDVSGTQAGGSASLDAVGAVVVSGVIRAESSQGAGGEIAVTGQSVLINDGADISSSGHAAGGRIRAGGDFQGRDTGLREADTIRVDAGASLAADAWAGTAGTVIVWANYDTIFTGEVSASALGEVGDGGMVEVSGKRTLQYDGVARVGSVNGEVGTVLFDPGNVVIGATGTTPPTLPGQPTTDSAISIASINNTLQSGANVIVATESGNIIVENVGAGGGDQLAGDQANNRHSAIQWTNSQSSIGLFASGSIIVNNHIRTSGAGSINLIGGWSGSEGDLTLQFDPQKAWDTYIESGQFGLNSGSVFIGNNAQVRHVEVGSRFGDTNVAGFEVRVVGSDSQATNRYSMIGFHDGGQAFAPRLNRGTDGGSVEIRLDMRVGAPGGSGAWLLSDGLNNADPLLNQAAAGVGDPIVAIVGNDFGQEVDLNGDGIADGVRGINSTGIVTESFIPYANHYNSATTGNWWWQRIEAAGSAEVKDPYGLGGLRPEHGAGIGDLSTVAKALRPLDGADINVIARGNVSVFAGNGGEAVSAQIGHGGPNRTFQNGMGYREIGNETVGNAAFSITGIEGGQMERRWSFNAVDSDRNGTAIGRLAPVYGNINVYAGVTSASPITVNHATGVVNATVGNNGSVVLRAAQAFDTSTPASNASAQIGHGGIGQFGEFFGDIHVEAGGSISILAGEATRASASIGHTITGHAYWNPSNIADQQLRFFATAGDFDNPNLRRGELFSGNVTTGIDPALDPERDRRYSLGDGFAWNNGGTWTFVGHTRGNYIRVATDGTGATSTGQYINVHTNDIIAYNPAQYTRGPSTGTTSQGTGSLGPLDLAPTGPITVRAIDGSIANGFHGDIVVRANTGSILLQGYNTEGITGSAARDSRFAAIGHGGRSFGYSVLGSGYQNIASGLPVVPGVGTASVDGRDIMTFHIPGGTGLQTGSRSEIGNTGTSLNRSLVFMSITGDIDVYAGTDITMMAGNDVYDYTRIGHGGPELADYETSSVLFGDIRVVAGGNVTIVGGGGVQPINRGNAGDPNQSQYDLRAWSQIGHGGYRSGFFGFLGDIDVTAGGNVLVRNGAHSGSFGKIGHQTWDDRGQSGGSFLKNEHFRADSVHTFVDTDINATSATVTFSQANGHASSLVGTRDFAALGAGDLIGTGYNTANISVVAGGNVTLDHMQMGERQPLARLTWLGTDLSNTNYNVENQGLGIRTRNSYAQIGHGGINTQAFTVNNTASNYDDKIGNITVTANGGNITVENGEGEQRWSRIGHGVGNSNRAGDDSNAPGYSRSIDLVGDIRVTAAGDIVINADAADENERQENTNSLFGAPTPSRYNPAAIGHGGVSDNLDVVVLGRGEDAKGIVASSDIIATAGGNLVILGGKGTEASFAQLGHGFTSDIGNDAARRFGAPTGFAGDITVVVGGNVYLEAGSNAWSEQPSGTGDNEGRSVTGAFAAIGHGGYQLDAPSFGDIHVYVGNDLDIIAQRRTDPFTDVFGQSPYTIQNPTVGLEGVASAFNFAKIGHFAVENGNRDAALGDLVQQAFQTGDITVVVGRDLRLMGGTTPDIDSQPIFGNFAQIGHGGPAAAGDKTGDITVLVKRDLSVAQGTGLTAGDLTIVEPNNYAMIGHGDYLKGIPPNASQSALFRRESVGNRIGDIVIAAGRNAGFDGALVGHADPALSSQFTLGNVQVAASRLNPFYGGEGYLGAVNGTVFASGQGGFQSRAEFYVPSRSHNLMDGTTRINEVSITFVEAPDDFAAPFDKSLGYLAGRADEVYLTPDLWWDETGKAAQANVPGAGMFPTDAFSGQGGALAIVSDPGGLENLESLVAGSLGGTAPTYRDNNGVSGAGRYTIYYDAIEFVKNSFPTQPVDPSIPTPRPPVFDFDGLFFPETYDAFFREDDISDGIGGEGSGLYPLLGVFERDEDTVEESGAWKLENALDNLFGDRRDSSEDEEEDEDKRRRRRRGQAGGQVGVTYYIYEPGTNRYSSYRVFGNQIATFYPVN